MQAIIREDEHTCPVCGQTDPHSMLKMKLGL
jgi:RNA polymerase subunit RPABC4/transcription elongation factor Spt4